MHALIGYFLLLIFLNIPASAQCDTTPPLNHVLEGQNSKDNQTIVQELLSLLPTGTEVCAPLYASVRLYLSILFSDQVNYLNEPTRGHKTKEESAAQCSAISNYLLNKSFSIPEHDIEQLYKSIALYEFENLRTPFQVKPRTEKSDLEKRDEQIVAYLKYAAVAAIVYLGTQAIFQEKLNAANIQIAAEQRSKEEVERAKTTTEQEVKDQKISMERQLREHRELLDRLTKEHAATIERISIGQQKSTGPTVVTTGSDSSNTQLNAQLIDLGIQLRKLQQDVFLQQKEKFRQDLTMLNDQVATAKKIAGATEQELAALKKEQREIFKELSKILEHGQSDARAAFKLKYASKFVSQSATAQTGSSASDTLGAVAGVIGGLLKFFISTVTS